MEALNKDILGERKKRFGKAKSNKKGKEKKNFDQKNQERMNRFDIQIMEV